MRYAVVIARSARREIERLPTDIARRILARLEQLSGNPRPPGTRKLHGQGSLYRLRSGQYRIVYRIVDDDALIDVIAVRHRSEAYR